MTMGHYWIGNDGELYSAEVITCSRCLEPNRITHRAMSDEMDMPVCFNCALEAWKYRGLLGQIRLEVVG